MFGMRVVVVGAGISGLTCARLLLRDEHDVTVVSGDQLQRTTSHLAAAVWFPTAAGPAAAVARWSAATYDVLAAEASAAVPGVVMRESLVLYRNAPKSPPPLPDWAAAVGGVRPARAEELPPGYPRGLRFVVPLVEMPDLPTAPARSGSCGPVHDRCFAGWHGSTTCSISARRSW